jgi:FKBP-type peptidyl-prolyl cis-trans isomerase
MKSLIIILSLVAIVGCRSKQEATIEVDTSMQNPAMPQPAAQPHAEQAPPQAAPPTGEPQVTGKHGDTVITADGLKWIDKTVGKGASPKVSNTVTANYKGMLTNGQVFDQSKEPFKSPLSNLIVGWQEGMATMKPGGKRRLIVPPHLGYGNQSQPGIPPNSTLVFDIDLLKVE